jgi:hypothetical protein
MLRLHSILGSLPVLVIMSACAVAVAGESEKPKCEQCTPLSRAAQLLVANQPAASARTASLAEIISKTTANLERINV